MNFRLNSFFVKINFLKKALKIWLMMGHLGILIAIVN